MDGALYNKQLLPLVINRTKTQTRRLHGLHEVNKSPGSYVYAGMNSLGEYCFDHYLEDDTSTMAYLKPRWPVGSIQYLREAWRLEDGEPLYKIGNQTRSGNHIYYTEEVKWLSPYHMKASQARYFQQIVGVRPERFTLKMPNDEYDKEGGIAALSELEKLANQWVWVYSIKILTREELEAKG